MRYRQDIQRDISLGVEAGRWATTTEAASSIGVNQSTISRMMNDEQKMKLKNVERLRAGKIASSLHSLSRALGYATLLDFANDYPENVASLVEQLSKALAGMAFSQWDSECAQVLLRSVRIHGQKVAQSVGA